jgi:microcystin-dependent protein
MDPFVAEIRIFPFTVVPTGWALCNGQLIPINQNTALFSVLGTFYGGNGLSTFALPNLQGSAPMFWGQGAGLSQRVLGEEGGSETVTLLESEIPAHSHTLSAFGTPGDLKEPQAGAVLTRNSNGAVFNPTASNLVTMAPQSLTAAGTGVPHNNMMPSLTLSFCISLQGVYPQFQ